MSDRTLTGAIQIPQWLRGKPDSGFDPSALSPPLYDDEFMQIRYNKAEDPRMDGGRLADHRGHSPNRPHGVDDGFHGINSECASSVVSCAQKILGVQPKPRHNRQRRNSKSLPASPLGSPESRRKLANRFFTLDENKEGTGSTSSLLEAIARVPAIRAKSSAPETGPSSNTDLRRPQPSEYREMNFWSPTSM